MDPGRWTGGAAGAPERRGTAGAPLDRVVFQSQSVCVGAFRCPAWHPLFRDSGAIQNHVFVFPRRYVRLRHEGKSAFLADPSVVTLYNRGQRYSRDAVGDSGDECEWFAVEPAVLLEAIREYDPGVDDHPQAPFRFAFGPCLPRTYLEQRALFERLRVVEPIETLLVEEGVLALLADVLARAYGFWASVRPAGGLSARQREAAEEVRLLLAARLGEPLRLAEIAREVGLSAFRLCRSFRAVTGSTIHAYRNRMRLQRALERLADGEQLIDVALDLGYSSHSHFSAAFGQVFGSTPSTVRRKLAPRAGGRRLRQARERA